MIELNGTGFYPLDNLLSLATFGNTGVGGSVMKSDITLPTMRSGDKGANVKALQTALVNIGYKIDPINGVYGPKTTSAVTMYQASQGLTSDGVAGENTIKALGFRWAGKSASAKPKVTPDPTYTPGNTSNPKTEPEKPSGNAEPWDITTYAVWGGVAVVAYLIAKKKGLLKRFTNG